MAVVSRIGRWVKWSLLEPRLRRFPHLWSGLARVRSPIAPRTVQTSLSQLDFIADPHRLIEAAVALEAQHGTATAQRWLDHLSAKLRYFEQTLYVVQDALHQGELQKMGGTLERSRKRSRPVAAREAVQELLRDAQKMRHDGRLRDSLGIFEKLPNLPSPLDTIPERLREMLRVVEEGAESFPLPARRDSARAGRGPVVFALHNSLPFDRSGYAIRTQMILSHLQDAGEAVDAFTRPGYPWDLQAHRDKGRRASEECAGVTYSRLDDRHIGYNLVTDSAYVDGYARLLVKRVRRREPRALHGASNYLNGLAVVAAGRLLEAPSVYEIRGLWHYSQAARHTEFRETELYRYQDLMEAHAAREADAVVTISAALKSHLVDRWELDPSKITVVPNAVDVERFRPVPRDEQLRESLGMGDRFLVGFVGSLTAYEGLDDLVNAVAGLGDEIGLLVVGDGRVRQRLEGLVEELGCRARVRFTGRVPFEDVLRYYSCCDVCAYPRKDMEVCRYVPPLKPLEAMASGVPVIVSNLPPLTELVDDARRALICDPGQPASLARAIARMSREEELRRRLAREGREWVVTHRSWKGSARQLSEVYSCFDVPRTHCESSAT